MADKLECRMKGRLHQFLILREKQKIRKQASRRFTRWYPINTIFASFGQQVECGDWSRNILSEFGQILR